MRQIAIRLAGISAVYFTMPVFLAVYLLLQLRSPINVVPAVALVAAIISLLSSVLLAKESRPGSAARGVSILLCVALTLLAFSTILAILDDKSFLSDPVSMAESAWIALLMVLAPLFTALVLSLPGPRSHFTRIIMAISAVVSLFAIFSIVMIFRDLMQASTIHAMLPLLWAYWFIEMPVIGMCIIYLALSNSSISRRFNDEA